MRRRIEIKKTKVVIMFFFLFNNIIFNIVCYGEDIILDDYDLQIMNIVNLINQIDSKRQYLYIIELDEQLEDIVKNLNYIMDQNEFNNNEDKTLLLDITLKLELLYDEVYDIVIQEKQKYYDEILINIINIIILSIMSSYIYVRINNWWNYYYLQKITEYTIFIKRE